MTIDNWLEIAALCITLCGGLYGLIRKDLRGMVNEAVNHLKEDWQNERINDLKRENELLRERTNTTK